MMGVHAKVKAQVFTQLTVQASREAHKAGFLRMGLMVEAEAKRLLSVGGRRKGRKSGVPSSPGKPPHAQTGNLRAAVSTAVKQGPPLRATIIIVGPTSRAWYGSMHEHDEPLTVGGKTFPPRPFMKPALYKVRNKMAGKLRGANLRRTSAGRQLEMKCRRIR